MDPHRPLKQGFGIFEAVLLGILVLSLYALAIRGRTKDAPPSQAQPREEVWSEDPAELPPADPAVAEPPPEVEPELEPEPEVQPPPSTGLGQYAVGAVIDEALPAINKCGRRHPADGLVDTRFTIEPNGKVSRVEILEAPDEELASCVAKQLKKLRFPESDGRTTVSYPFAFEND